jgi:hypothetical protein
MTTSKLFYSLCHRSANVWTILYCFKIQMENKALLPRNVSMKNEDIV